jgi:TPP-dependent pyruvate/acetoin dehydrogenase alpha subunit
MARKKKNKTATATARRKASSTRASRSAPRKASAKKKKPANIVQAVLNAAKLRELYSTMVKCRMLAERMYGAQISQQPDRAISGLEATLVGAGAHLLPQDCIALEHSGFIASLIKGTPLRVILARTRAKQANNGAGKTVSPAREAAASMKPSMATGVALAQEMKGRGAVTLMFCIKDGGKLAFDPDAMSLAASQKLPMVCLVESSFGTRSESLAQSATAGDDSTYYPRIAVDGCDVVAVFRVTQEAIRRAREGHGPALIECVTSRTNGLAQPGNELLSPLLFMEQYLRRRDLWSDEWSRLMVAAFTRELDDALASVHEHADLDDDFDNVYADDGWKPPSESRPSEQQADMPAR